MRTGEVSKLLGVTVTTLRRWERRGFLKPDKDDFGWRIYNAAQVYSLKKRLVAGRPDGKRLVI